jgi:hypothetical protein
MNYVPQNQYNMRFGYVDLIKWQNKLVAFVQAKDTSFDYKSRFVLNYFNENTLALDSMYEIPFTDLDNRDLAAYKVIMTNKNEELILAGFGYEEDSISGREYGFVMNLGLDRKIKWFTEFNTSGGYGQIYDIQKFKDTYVVVGNENENIFVARMDTHGNVLWNKTYSNLRQRACILVDEEKNKIYVGSQDEGEFEGTSLMHNPRLLALDTNGVVFWSKTYTNFRRYEFNSFLSLAYADDSNIIAMSTPLLWGIFSGNLNLGFQTAIIKLDKTNGEIIFNRCFQIGDNDETITDTYHMITTDNGSVYLAGIYGHRYGSIMGFMQKLNSEGCPGVPCNCELGWLSDEEDEKAQLSKEELKVYPNPFEHSIRIENAEFYPDADVVITDLSGRVVHQQKLRTEIDLHFLKSGMYILTLSSKNQNATFKISKQ